MTSKEALNKIKALFADAAAMPPVEPAPVPSQMEAKEYVLEGGTKVLISSLEIGGMVSVVSEDGTATPAPVGEHKLADGTVITVDEAGIITAISVPEVMPEMEPETEDMRNRIAQLESNYSLLFAEMKIKEQSFNDQIKQANNKMIELADIMSKMIEVPSNEPTQKVHNNFDSHVKQTRGEKIESYLDFVKTFKNK